MAEEQIGHLLKLSIGSIKQNIDAEPRVPHTKAEVDQVLHDLYISVDHKNYVPQTPTVENPALSDEYIFDTEDENLVLKDLKQENFVGKILDLSKGAKKRKKMGLPQEYLYVFQYPCKLIRRDADDSGIVSKNVLIYIKINNRKTPYEKVFIVSFHENREKK